MGELGLVCGDPPPEGVELHVHLAKANSIEEDEALEWLAGAFHMLPMAPPRPACSSRAEAIFRKLAFGVARTDPWLPLGTVGPLLIATHYNPTSGVMWDIPPNSSSRSSFQKVPIKFFSAM